MKPQCGLFLHKLVVPQSSYIATVGDTVSSLPTRVQRRRPVVLADLLQLCTGVLRCRRVHD